MRCTLFLALLAGVSAEKQASFLKARAFRPSKGHPDVQEAKNVCVSIKDPCATKLSQAMDDESNQFLATHLNLHPMPAGFQGKVVESALLVTKAKIQEVDHHQTAFARTSEEWSETMIPVFDFAHDLKQNGGSFSAVLMPQVPNAAKFMGSASFDGDMLDSLLETSGSSDKAEKLFCEDMKKETAICFNRLAHYRHIAKKEPSLVAASALRKHAMLKESNANNRKAVLVIRKDHMGWMNYVEVEQKLRVLLEEKCWTLSQVEHANAPVQQAIEDLKEADLVIANHGPHVENLIWMPKKAGFIEDKNCKCADYGHENLANQQGLIYATSGAAGDQEQCLLQKKGHGICTKDKPRVVDFHAEIEPVVLSMLEDLEKDRSDIPQRCATTEEALEFKSV